LKVIFLILFIVTGYIGIPHYACAKNELPPQVVILQYHHVATDTPAITSVSPDTFRQHMDYLSQHHTVVSLKDAMYAVENELALPANAVAITFDDGYTNILQNADPILREYDFPYTVFINPDSINTLNNQLTWEQVKQMQPLADFANHTRNHLHLLEQEEGETAPQWLTRVMVNIEQAETALKQRLGYSRKWLAYPYGEFNMLLESALADAGYTTFGQHSGVVSTQTSQGALPRFPAAGRYANIDTLKVKMAAIAMPVIRQHPAESEQKIGTVLPSLTLELTEANNDIIIAQAACYFKGQRIIPDVTDNQLSVKLEHQFSPGRVRINCTAPSRQHTGRFYWYSAPFFTPTESGKFLD
jgi:peptidoglycan/xylan/chitin deacetylase (PgdA/CDA1 family)